MIIAIATYGKHTILGPDGKVKAYKLGYTSAAYTVLFVVCDGWAHDVTPRRADYHYVQLDHPVTVYRDYILLRVPERLRDLLEMLTRRVAYPRVYCWMEDGWRGFPGTDDSGYTTRSVPNALTADLALRTMTDVETVGTEPEEKAATITITRSQRSAGETPWYWIGGETYPHKELLKAHGCRWSRKRRQWYFKGETLPAAIRALAEPEAPENVAAVADNADDDPCTVEEAAAILGMQPRTLELPELPYEPSRFAVGDVVYAQYELVTRNNTPVHTGTRGIITRIYKRNPRHGWSYEVDFEGSGEDWYIERELTDWQAPKGIRRQVPRRLFGDAPSDHIQHDATFKREARERGDHPEPYTPEDTPKQPAAATAQPADDEQDAARRIRTIPHHMDNDDPLRHAIQQTRDTPRDEANEAPANTANRIPIPHTFCGELTGSISGNVWAYGYAIHDGVCIYLNMGGPRTAVEAIRAKLARGDIVNCIPPDAPAIELTAGEGNTGKYTAYMHNIPEARFTSVILVHEDIVNPNYLGDSTTFIFHISEAQIRAQLHQHLDELVSVPVFPDWIPFLWDAGRHARLVRPTRTGGDLRLWTLDLDADAWTRLITGALAEGVLQLPENNATERNSHGTQ